MIFENGKIEDDENPKKKYKLDPMSEEQILVYKQIACGFNVIVDACAGSGKSTTILSIAKNMPEKSIMQMTYNSTLCNEIKSKARELELENLKIHTFHSLVVKYYTSEGYTDTIIRRVLSNNTPPRIPIKKIDILVLDEAQDMTFLYFKLMVKFCRDMGCNIQLLILGDYKQGLYEFKGADIRFLTCAETIWKDFELLKTKFFYKTTLKTSYRVTNQMASFVNNVMLGENRLVACRDGPKVTYLRRSTFNAKKYIVNKIKKIIETQGASPADFFILGGSVKGENSSIRKMENALVEIGIPCHVPMMETDKIDERVIEGKLVFSTFHSVKGRQRKYVFVMGFDHSYFTYFARNLSPIECPNTLYVACTRATHELFIIERDEERQFNRPFKFLKKSHHQMKQEPYIDFQGIPQSIFYKKTDENDENGHNVRMRNGRALPFHNVTPTELIKFIPESVIEEIVPILESIFDKISPEPPKENDKSHELDIPSIIKTRNGFHEDVSDLNGIAIPMMYFDYLFSNKKENKKKKEENTDIEDKNKDKYQIESGGKVIINIIDSAIEELKPYEHQFLKQIVENIPRECNNISDYLYISNVYIAVKEKLYSKINQIKRDEYIWLSDEVMDKCFERIGDVLEEECIINGKFTADVEKTIIYSSDDKAHEKIDDFLCEFFPNELFRFTARTDLITDDSVWEIKCTSMISNDHFLQVVIYAWIWRMISENVPEFENIKCFKIFNIKTGEIYILNAYTSELNTIMLALLRGKYGNKIPQIDNDFIKDCRSHIMGREVYVGKCD